MVDRRISIKGLLIFTALVAISLACVKRADDMTSSKGVHAYEFIGNLGLRELTQLQWLSLNNTQVSDLGPLRELSQLQLLDLDGTQVTDLTPLVKMRGVMIHLDGKQKVTVPEELKDCVRYY
ncbi:MAG: leucine-rich repeat domain-containing protein [Planctomycetes bacterium]|nr:leucine-rich repeat domain-containing protein [Planctomycetota bacterium]